MTLPGEAWQEESNYLGTQDLPTGSYPQDTSAYWHDRRACFFAGNSYNII